MPYQPTGKYFEDFEPGATFESAARTVTEADIAAFAGLSGDYNPLHTDEEFAKGTPFGRRIAHGMLVLSIASGLAGRLGFFDQTVIAFGGLTGKFTAPTFAGDTLHLVMRVTDRKPAGKPDRGTVTFAIEVVNQKGTKVAETEWTLLVKRRPA